MRTTYLSVPPLALKPFRVGNSHFLPLLPSETSSQFTCCVPVPPAFRELVLVVAPLSVQLTSPSIGSVPLAFHCAQTSSILRNNCNLSSAAWSLPPTTKRPCRSLHHKFLEYLSPLICPFFRCPLMLQSFLIRILPPTASPKLL